METIGRLCSADEALLLATAYRVVDVTDAAQTEDASAWWTGITGRGDEGIVVKPLSFVARGSRRSEEHTSELQSLMRISYAVFCLKKKKRQNKTENKLTN